MLIPIKYIALGFILGLALAAYRGDFLFLMRSRKIAEPQTLLSENSGKQAAEELLKATTSPTGEKKADVTASDSPEKAAQKKAPDKKTYAAAIPTLPKIDIKNAEPATSQTPEPSPEPKPRFAPGLNDNEIYARIAPAVVQIFCQAQNQVAAATGIIVTKEGLVLANAHVADLVKKSGTSNCQARHGNPASPFAKLEIVFIADTSKKIAETDVPEKDIAFLRLVDAKEQYGFAPLEIGIVSPGEQVLTLGYPSEFLESISTLVNSNLLFSVLTLANYGDIDGDRETVEAYVFRGGLALQQGSSGTPLINRSGRVVGMIFATTKGKTTEERDGIALTIPYINAVLKNETGENLAQFLATH